MKRRDETTATVISVMAPPPRAALRTRAVAMALSRIPERRCIQPIEQQLNSCRCANASDTQASK